MPRHHRLSLLLLTALATAGIALACDSPSGPAAVGSIAPVASFVPSAPVATGVTLQLVIEDEDGNPLEGVGVAVEVASGGGSVEPDSTTSGSDGRASVIWTLGTEAGEQTLRVTAREYSTTVAVQAEAGPAARLVLLSRARVEGTVAEALSSPVRVQVQDRYDNPVPEHVVTFRPRAEAHGSVSAESALTDGDGVASSSWTLGSGVGDQWLDVRAQGATMVTVQAEARAGPPTVMELVSGDGQTGPVGEALPEPLVVRVFDGFGNPAAGARITFSPEEGGGATEPASAEADFQGRARADWTLGTEVGSWTLEATAEGLDQGVTFEAQSVPGPPARVQALSGDGQEGFAGVRLNEPLEVRVLDRFDNPVPFAVVQFQATAGGGSATPGLVTADEAARAATTWTLGPSTGEQSLEARSDQAEPAVFTATAGSLAPAEIQVVSGDGQSGQVASELAEPVTVRVLDVNGTPVEGAGVELAVTAGGGSVAQAQLTSDASGQAATTWTLGTRPAPPPRVARGERLPDPAVVSATATPGPPAAVAVASGDQQSAPVGQALADPVVARAQDEFGNGVEGIQVTFSVTGGGGSVSPASATTDGSGLASAAWTLGTEPGANALEASADGLGTAAFTATAISGAPDRIEALSGDGQTGTVATELPEPVQVRVLDEFGNPLPGVSVEFAASGSQAGATPEVAATDDQGRASAAWTLGTEAGAQSLEARVDGVSQPATFAATAVPGPPAAVESLSGDGQGGAPGADLSQPFVARVTDAYQNPVQDVTVSWTVVQGNGSLSAASSVTDAQGRAQTAYTVGSAFGEHRVEASVADLAPAVFTVLVGNDLSLAAFYVTQAAQPLDGSTPLVAGRPGLLRIFVQAAASNTFTPAVRVRLYQGGSLVDTRVLEAPESSVRTGVDESALTTSWNLELPASTIQPGLGIQLEIDPDDQAEEVDESNNLFPSGGGPHPLDVRELLPFMTRLVPIEVSSLGTVGDVDEGNMDDYMADVFAMMPMPDYDVDVREPYSSSVSANSTFDEWVQLLNEMLTLRTEEGSERYYYGVIGQNSGAPFCGLGYLGLPAALGQDVCGAGTAAHEWGHNWDRLHTPCGNPASPDPDYPYPEASIGIWGLDPFTGQLKDPDAYKDLMSYCGPEWISDYTYDGVFSFRENEAASPAALRTAVEPSLILWGRISPDGLVLEPAFRTRTRPSLPRRGGPYAIRGLAADGTELFRFSFAGAPVDHAPDGHRHFSFAVPTRMASPDALDRLVLEAPGRPPAVRARSAALVEGEAELSLRREGAGRVRLSWNPATAPMVVVRNPATGAILSFARGGEAVVRTDAAELELELAGGVESVRRVVPVR